MPPIKCRNRKNIHKGKNDRNKGGGHPESLPVPGIGEKTANSTKTSHLGSPFFGKYIFELRHVIMQRPIGKIKAFGLHFQQENIFHGLY